jgi:hypothetical protein
MDYYKSSMGGVYKVYAGDSTTGKLTIILDYKGLGMYNVLNQKLSTTGASEYNSYIVGLSAATKSEFTTYVDLAKTFLTNL